MIIRLLFVLFVGILPITTGYAQDEEEEWSPEIVTELGDAPIYISGGLTYANVYGKEYPDAFGYQFFGEGGILMQYSMFREFPFYTGLEFLRRGYSYNQTKNKVDQFGRKYEDKVTGRAKLAYLSIPFLFQIPASNPSKKLHVMAGINMNVRVFFSENFEASRTIPEDSLVIEIPYSKIGTNALDVVQFNLVAGVKYRILPRLEVLGLASMRGFGFSIGKENFFNRTELGNAFTIKLIYRIATLDQILFF